MVHQPTRGDVPVRLGPAVRQVPEYGPSTMSRDVYTDPVRFELERERVLGRSWLLAGRSEQAKGAGDWITFEGHGETVVVARQRDGSLAAFHNVCQHRGPALVTDLQGCGARRFTCPVGRDVDDRFDRALFRGRQRRVERLVRGAEQRRFERRTRAPQEDENPGRRHEDPEQAEHGDGAGQGRERRAQTEASENPAGHGQLEQDGSDARRSMK